MHSFFAKRGTTGASADPSKPAVKKTKPLPWVEKHRPKTIDDVVGQEEAVSMLRQCVVNPTELPNLLFYGPPGTGKTSAALALARKLFHAHENPAWRERVLELNASDERGIQVVREKIRRFAELATPAQGNIPALRIIILDEADAITTPAQAALRRVMEKEAARTRFFLICNYRSRIISPIASRCASFRFRSLEADATVNLLTSICKEEGVKFADGDNEDQDVVAPKILSGLVEACEGDLRRAVAYLQSSWRLRAPSPLKSSDLQDLVGIIHPEVIETFNKTVSASSFDEIQAAVKEALMCGYSAGQFCSQLHDVLVENEFLTDKQKAAICAIIAESDGRLADGADDYLQLMDVACVMASEMRQ